MSLAALLAAAIATGIAFVPVWLLRQREPARARDAFVASPGTRREVVRNASIACSLRVVAFGPLFVWGARGDFWPVLLSAASFAAGICLVHRFRRPLVAFLDDALERDRSITVHAFVAQQHGNSSRVRTLAASMSVIALVGLLCGEALLLAVWLGPAVPGGAITACAFVFGLLLLAMLQAVCSGHSGVMHAAQIQLGTLYLALFGSMTVLLYLQVSALTPMPAHGTLAVALAAVCCPVLLWYRRTRYIDTVPIRPVAPGARALSRVGKILNLCVSILLALAFVVATMALFAAGPSATTRDTAAALTSTSLLSAPALVTLCLLPLVYPLVDVTTWQKLAAGRLDPDRQATSLRNAFRVQAAETALMALVVWSLGAIAALVSETPDGKEIVARFAGAGDGMTAVILPLLLIGTVAAALSTMSALFSATLCTIRYDLLATRAHGTEAAAARRTQVAAGGLALACAAGFCIADAMLERDPARTLLAVLFALVCAQLSLAPLVVGAIAGRSVSAGWAIVTLGSGAATGIGCAAAYLVGGTEPWLWAAVPACLVSGSVMFAAACASRRR